MSNKSRKNRRRNINEARTIARQTTPLPGNSLTMSQHIVTWKSGPIPSPEDFDGYERALPGAADRIMTMAEVQTRHRIGLENKVINHDIIKSYLGLACGVIVCLAGFYFAYRIVELGHPIAGSVIGFGPLAGLVGVFMQSTNLRNKERDLMRQQQERQSK